MPLGVDAEQVSQVIIEQASARVQLAAQGEEVVEARIEFAQFVGAREAVGLLAVLLLATSLIILATQRRLREVV